MNTVASPRRTSRFIRGDTYVAGVTPFSRSTTATSRSQPTSTVILCHPWILVRCSHHYVSANRDGCQALMFAWL